MKPQAWILYWRFGWLLGPVLLIGGIAAGNGLLIVLGIVVVVGAVVMAPVVATPESGWPDPKLSHYRCLLGGSPLARLPRMRAPALGRLPAIGGG